MNENKQNQIKNLRNKVINTEKRISDLEVKVSRLLVEKEKLIQSKELNQQKLSKIESEEEIGTVKKVSISARNHESSLSKEIDDLGANVDVLQWD